MAPAARRSVPSWHDPHAVALGFKCRAELAASRTAIGEGFHLVDEAAQERLVVRVAAHEMEMAASNGTVIDHYFNQPANPAGMPAAEMAGAESEIAKTIGERSALVDFDWQWVMRPMSHHYIGTGIDRGVCNVRHVLQRFAPEASVARCDDNVDLRAQGLDVVANSPR
jgi:hypothetical protein